MVQAAVADALQAGGSVGVLVVAAGMEASRAAPRLVAVVVAKEAHPPSVPAGTTPRTGWPG